MNAKDRGSLLGTLANTILLELSLAHSSAHPLELVRSGEEQWEGVGRVDGEGGETEG